MKRWASDWLIPRSVALLGAMAVSLSGTSGDWPVYGYDASATRYLSPLNRSTNGVHYLRPCDDKIGVDRNKISRTLLLLRSNRHARN
jgi:hypothetical protein